MIRVNKLVTNLKEIAFPDESIVWQIVRTNLTRIIYLSTFSIPMRILTIISFMLQDTNVDPSTMRWQRGIIISHTSLLLFYIVMNIWVRKLVREAKPRKSMKLVQYTAIIVMLLSTIIITLIDQLVTNNITPYIMICVAIGTIFLIKPLYSILSFGIGYGIFYLGLGFMTVDPVTLLSNRINGITATVLGICLNLILWKTSVDNLWQRAIIDRQQGELEKINRELESLSRIDSLTGLINRRTFEELARDAIMEDRRNEKKSCFLMLDLDNFKEINDKYGHPIGDIVLREVSKFIRSQLRESDLISRIGGDEIAVLLLNTDIENGRLVANQLGDKIKNKTFHIENNEIKVSASIGISLVKGEGESFNSAYRSADKALYEAKLKGKNLVKS